MFFRLLDELFYASYRKVHIRKPLFIISNPRSGTTFLQRLLCSDEERFVYARLYHTLLPAVSLYKLVEVLSLIDVRIGSPLAKLVRWVERRSFKGWDGIHPTGFNYPEEDEGYFSQLFLSTGVSIYCPYMEELTYLTITDHLPTHVQQRLKNYYWDCLQRFYYYMGNDRTLFVKNVNSTGRLKMLQSLFPDARIIYLVRHPYEAVPSFVSMFAASWSQQSPDIPLHSPQHRALAQIPIDFYKYFMHERANIPQNQLYTVRYNDLIATPLQVVLSIYKHFGIPITPTFEQQLSQHITHNTSYQRKHSYTLQMYNITPDEVHQQLTDLFETFQFDY